MRGSWRPNRTAIYWPPLLWPSALCLSCSPVLLNRRPGGPASLGHVLIPASSHQLVWSPNSIGGPEGPFCRVVAFSTTSWLRPLRFPTHWLPVFTELYNSSIAHSIYGMFDRHQAEITVMQFTGHSLPLHQSMSVKVWIQLFSLQLWVK